MHQKLVASEFLKEILYFISYSLLGIGMSCLIFLPALFNILSVSRLTVEKKVPVLYEMYYYLKLFGSFISSTSGVHYERMGYTAIGLFAIVLLFTYTGKKRGGVSLTA